MTERQAQVKVHSEEKAFERLKAELASAFAAQRGGDVSSVDGRRDCCSQLIPRGLIPRQR